MSSAETSETPSVPAGARDAGRRLWLSVVSEYDLDEHETAILLEAVRTVDLLQELEARAAKDGAVIDSPQGLRAHPAVVEARQQRIALARLLAALRLPAGEAGDRQANARPQRRAGVRRPYGIRGAVS